MTTQVTQHQRVTVTTRGDVAAEGLGDTSGDVAAEGLGDTSGDVAAEGDW